MKNSIFDKIKKVFKLINSIFSFIRFLVIILLFVFIFNLLFTLNFDTLKDLSVKEKILYIFRYPTNFIQVKKDSKNAIILVSALKKKLEILQSYISNYSQSNTKFKNKQTVKQQQEEGYVKQAISEGENLIILRFDGTVVASGNNDYGQCNVSQWENIDEIGVGIAHTVGLKKDGTVVATGNNDFGQCNVSHWKNIISIGAGNFHTVGLKDDGTVIATGNNNFGQCNVFRWENIVEIKIGENYSIGLQEGNKEFVVGKRTATMKAAIEKMKEEEIEKMKKEKTAEITKEAKKEEELKIEGMLKKIQDTNKETELNKVEEPKKEETKKIEIKELEIKEFEM